MYDALDATEDPAQGAWNTSGSARVHEFVQWQTLGRATSETQPDLPSGRTGRTGARRCGCDQAATACVGNVQATVKLQR